jgi:hypothetical protein
VNHKLVFGAPFLAATMLLGCALPRSVVGPKEAAALDFQYGQTRCPRGLNFFLVPRDFNHGYWVGPMYPQAGSRIDLVIEKYAGLSSANLSRE